MTSIRYPLAGCAVAAALGAMAAVGVAHAQPGPQGAPGQSGGGSQMQRLHDALQLTPHQQQAWQGYQVALRPPADQVQRVQAMRQMQLASMSTPQRLDMINEELNMQLASFHRNADATRAFYATLTPSQQRTFDQATAPPSHNTSSR